MRYKDTDFLYASGRIKVLELYLMDKNAVDKLIDAKNITEMMKILADLGYPFGESLDEMLLSAQKVTRDLIFSVVSEKQLVAFLLYPYDYHNIKALLKSEITGDNAEGILSNAGFFDKEEMQRALLERNTEDLTENMQKGIEEALSLYAKTQDVRDIDITLDGYCFADMMQSARLSNDSFVIDFVKLQIDLTNIKNLVRLKKFDASKELAARVFLEGGNIQKDKFADNYTDSIKNIREEFKDYDLAHLISDKGSAGDIDRICNDYLLSYLNKAKYVGYGFLVVSNYMFAKENEQKTIRIIAASKSAGLSAEEIRQVIY